MWTAQAGVGKTETPERIVTQFTLTEAGMYNIYGYLWNGAGGTGLWDCGFQLGKELTLWVLIGTIRLLDKSICLEANAERNPTDDRRNRRNTAKRWTGQEGRIAAPSAPKGELIKGTALRGTIEIAFPSRGVRALGQ